MLAPTADVRMIVPKGNGLSTFDDAKTEAVHYRPKGGSFVPDVPSSRL